MLFRSQVESAAASMLRAQGVDPTKFGYGTSAPVTTLPGTGTRTGTTGQPVQPSAQTQTAPAPGTPPQGQPSVPGQAPRTGQAPSSTDQNWINTPPSEVNLIDKTKTQLRAYAERWPEHFNITGQDDPRAIRRDLDAMRVRYDKLISSSDPEMKKQAESLRTQMQAEQTRLNEILDGAIGTQLKQNEAWAADMTKSANKFAEEARARIEDRKSTRLNSSH